MNPRLVLHLFATDWRRLRWFLLLAWLLMLLGALPALRFKFGDHLPYSSPDLGYFEGDIEAERTALHRLLYPLRIPWPNLWSGYAMMALPLLLAGISASLGFHGAGWAKVRPLRWRERALAALLALLAFIVLPQCALIVTNTLAHGFSGGEALHGALQAGALILCLHACSMVVGRVCGSLWRWVAALAGISVIVGLISFIPYVPYWLRESQVIRIGWWGEYPNQLRPLLVTLAVMLAVIALFRGGRRPRLRTTLILLSAALVPPLVMTQRGGPRYDPPNLRDLPRHSQAASIHAEYVPGSLFRHQTHEKKTTTTLEASIRTIGLPEDEKMMWMLDEAAPFSHQGRTLPQKWGWFPTWRGKDLPNRQLPMAPKEVVPLPFKIKDRDRDWSSMTKRLWIGDFDLTGVSTASPELDMDAGLLGIALRYHELLRAPLQDTIDLEPAGFHGGTARVIRSGPLAPAVDMSYLVGSPQKGGQPYADADPMKEFLCFLHLGGDRYVEGKSLHHKGRLLLTQVSAIRRIIKFPDVKEEELADARLVLVRLEVTGSIRSRVRAHGLSLSPVRDFSGHSDPKDYIGPSRSDWRYPRGRPSPETCTEDQAGQWYMQVLNSSDRNGGRDLAPFVKRFPKLFLSYQSPWHHSEPVVQALTLGLPESQRHLVLDAFAKSDNRGKSQHLKVILARGWQAECRETVLRGLREDPSDDLVSAAASYGDPTLYPLLLEAMDKLHSRASYYAIRRLPGIEPALSRKVEAGFMRDLPAFMADPNSSEQALKLGVPAAHGSAEAYALLFPPSRQTYSHGGSSEALHILMHVSSAPAEINTWEGWAKFMKAHQATDFHYDSFTGSWFPNNAKHSAK